MSLIRRPRPRSRYARFAHAAVGAASAAYEAYSRRRRSVATSVRPPSPPLRRRAVPSRFTGRRSLAVRPRQRYHPGRAAGFVTAPKKLSRSSKNKKFAMMKAGVYMTTERAFATSTEDCQFIGHATFPTLWTYTVVAQALVKSVFVQLGACPPDMQATIPYTVAGESIQIGYRLTETPAEALSYEVFNTNATTYSAVGDAIALWLQARTEQCVLVSIHYQSVPATSFYPYVRFNLLNTMIKLTSKSSLKFQNRSINETGDEDANDVDNVPLNGKSYEGKGTGTTFTVPTTGAKPFVANQYGVINVESTVSGTNEPPFGQLFRNVKKGGKVRIDPGEVKTSVIQSSLKTSLNRFQRVHDVAGPSATDLYQQGLLGKFRMFALEKMIGGLSTAEIQLACEVNLLIGATVKLGRQDLTTAIFTKSAE